jgi:hypothetical protein
MILITFFYISLFVAAQNLSSSSEFGDLVEPVPLNDYNRKSYIEPSTPRHREEKTRLLDILKRETGEWDINHPRYQLLQALRDVSRYKESHFTELEQWQDAYKGIPDEQKQV